MKITTTLQNEKIKLSEPSIPDVYFIEQGENGRFYITSTNGYWGYDGKGYTSLFIAIKQATNMISNFFADRCEPNPIGWRKNIFNHK
jgi:hypothetical protein